MDHRAPCAPFLPLLLLAACGAAPATAPRAPERPLAVGSERHEGPALRAIVAPRLASVNVPLSPIWARGLRQLVLGALQPLVPAALAVGPTAR